MIADPGLNVTIARSLAALVLSFNLQGGAERRITQMSALLVPMLVWPCTAWTFAGAAEGQVLPVPIFGH